MFEEKSFAPIENTTQITRRCYICGNSGGTFDRYHYTGFVLHKDCRDKFKENVLEFLNDSSEDILVESL